MSCSICLDDDSTKEFYVTSCNHIFHKECLLKTNTSVNYLDNIFTHISCPMCRNQLSLHKIHTYKFSYNILSNDDYLMIKKIARTIKELHFNKNYIFISGGFSNALYSKLTNKNKKFEYNDIDIYYIDYDNIYEKGLNSRYFSSCELNLHIKNIKKNYSNDYDRTSYDIIYLYPTNKYVKNIKQTIQSMFESYDLSCCKTAFIFKDDYIQFYVHEDYFLNKVNLCSYSLFCTGNRMEKYKKRGYTFDKFTECCQNTHKSSNNSFFTYHYSDYDVPENSNNDYYMELQNNAHDDENVDDDDADINENDVNLEIEIDVVPDTNMTLSSISNFENNLTNLETDLTNLETNLTNLETNLNSVDSEIDMVRNGMNELENILNELRTNINEYLDE